MALGVAAAVIASHHDDNDERDDRNDYRESYRNDGYDPYEGDPRRTFRCESNDGALTFCDMPGHGHVEVFKKISSSECRYGDSWVVNGRRVWVSLGCRAEFAIY